MGMRIGRTILGIKEGMETSGSQSGWGQLLNIFNMMVVRSVFLFISD